MGDTKFSFRSRGRGLPRQALAEGAGVRRLQTSSGSLCAKSWLGYQCTQLACGRIRIHWSLGGDPPSGPGCSYAQNTTTQAVVPDPAAQLLHITLQTDLTGYVALSWPRTPGAMYPADAVIGFKDRSGKPNIAAYKVLGYRPSDVLQDSSVDILNTGLEANATSLTICFTRNITQVGPAASISIATQALVGMNFVASHMEFSAPHSLNNDHVCGASMFLYQPVSGSDDGGWRPSNVSGGNEEGVLAERLGYMRAHGALQFTGWIVLVPIGILSARHRWLFTSAGVAGMWFKVHRAVQMVATVLIVAGFVLPWTSFDSDDEQQVMGVDHEARMASDTLLESHETLAITLMALLGLHIAIAILRPKPESLWRRTWNLVHWWTGRGLAVLAGVNVAIGIALWRRVSGGSGAEWVVPLVLFGAGWLVLAVWAERRAPEGLGREDGQGVNGVLTAGFVPSSSPGSSPTGGVPLSRLSGGPQTQISIGLEYSKL